MDALSKPSSNHNLCGIYQRNIDKKGRVILPIEWLEIFGPRAPIIILNAGDYLIIMPESGYGYSNESDIISIKEILDSSRRVTIGQNIQESFNLKLEGFVGLIGKGNHIELYLNEDMFKNSIKRSMDAVKVFQKNLIATLEKK